MAYDYSTYTYSTATLGYTVQYHGALGPTTHSMLLTGCPQTASGTDTEQYRRVQYSAVLHSVPVRCISISTATTIGCIVHASHFRLASPRPSPKLQLQILPIYTR